MKQFVRVLVFAAMALCLIASAPVEVSAGTQVFDLRFLGELNSQKSVLNFCPPMPAQSRNL
jgi:hypothetical protein